MESQKPNSFKLAMTYGLYLGLISIVLSVITWATNAVDYLGLFGTAFLGILQLTLIIFLLLYFTKQYRNNELGGKITFGQAFVFGVLIVVLSAIVNSLYTYIFNKFIDPEYTQRVLTMMQDKTYQFMSNRGMPQDQIDAALKNFDVQEISSPIEMLISSMEFGLIGGAFMSLFSSLIIKKNTIDEDAFDEAMDEIKNEE